MFAVPIRFLTTDNKKERLLKREVFREKKKKDHPEVYTNASKNR